MKPSDVTCETCDYCNTKRKTCQFNPPVVLSHGDTVWPKVDFSHHSWCALHSELEDNACGCDIDEEDE